MLADRFFGRVLRVAINSGLLIILCVGSATQAAEIRRVEREYCLLELQGPIRAGDARKIEAAIRKEPYEYVGSICLNSPGGSYGEGLKIAKLLYKKGVGTVVDRGAECTSSCAIAFMGGTIRADGEPYLSRKLHALGRLGFHAPYVHIPDGEYSGQTVQNAHNAAIRALAQLMSMSPNMKIKAGLLAEMAKKGPKELFWIDTIDKVGRWNIDLFGYQLLKSSLIGRDQFVWACDNAYNWKNDKYGFRVSSHTDVSYKKRRVAGELRVAVGHYPPEGSALCILKTPDEIGPDTGGMREDIPMSFWIGEGTNNLASVSFGFKSLPSFAIYPPDTPIRTLGK